LRGRQIIFDGEFKKPLSDTDKLFGQGNTLCQHPIAGKQQTGRGQGAEQAACQASEKCRFGVHNIKKSKARAD
jgi:hypothetical protein